MSYEKRKSDNFSNFGGINSKISPYQTGKNDCLRLVNLDFSQPGSWSKRPGSTLYTGATPVAGRVTSVYEYEKLNGFSQLLMTANTNVYSITPTTTTPVISGLLNGGIFDFTTFVDYLFAANGTDFFKYDGTNNSRWSLPAPPNPVGVSIYGGPAGLSGTYVFYYGYRNERGFVGPVSPGLTVTVTGLAGNTDFTVYGLTTPAGYGISAIYAYLTNVDGVEGFLFATFAAGSPTLGVTLPLTDFLAPDLTYVSGAPKYLEIFNNSLFTAGWSATPSTAWFSNIGEPEAVAPDSFIEVRTNDGDMLTGLKSYRNQLFLFKNRSFHQLAGDSPDNYSLSEVSDQYGCISNRTAQVYEDYLVFLDQTGVIRFNGANIEILSDPIEPIIRTINLSAARENAVAIHYKERQEVWFAVPTNGATLNNTILVYDYSQETRAWTTFEGVLISSLVLAKGPLADRTPFFGGYSGSVFRFGSSFLADNGVGITCLVQTRFHGDLGQSVQKMWRRLYGNFTPIPGTSTPVNVGFYTDYGTTLQLSRVMYQAPFQTRIDFGLSGRAISMEFAHFSASENIRIPGYTIEYRFLRNV